MVGPQYAPVLVENGKLLGRNTKLSEWPGSYKMRNFSVIFRFCQVFILATFWWCHLDVISQGSDSKINGTRVVTFSTPRGCFWDIFNSNFEGVTKCFCRYKGVEGVALMSESEKLTINSMILLCFMLLKGVISTFKREYVRITGADGALAQNDKKRWRGFLKFSVTILVPNF